jgi:hypothetical protein
MTQATDPWTCLESPLLSVQVPHGWEPSPTGDDRVIVAACPITQRPRFRANVVVSARPSEASIVEIGARSIAEALAVPGWSHVASDEEWQHGGATGRRIEFLYDEAGVCVSVIRSSVIADGQLLDVTASCDILDRLRWKSVFTQIAASAELRGDA